MGRKKGNNVAVVWFLVTGLQNAPGASGRSTTTVSTHCYGSHWGHRSRKPRTSSDTSRHLQGSWVALVPFWGLESQAGMLQAQLCGNRSLRTLPSCLHSQSALHRPQTWPCLSAPEQGGVFSVNEDSFPANTPSGNVPDICAGNPSLSLFSSFFLPFHFSFLCLVAFLFFFF